VNHSLSSCSRFNKKTVKRSFDRESNESKDESKDEKEEKERKERRESI